MSGPEEIRTDSVATPASIPAMEAGQAVSQLRALVCGLGLAVLALSLVFDAFVFKQNRNIQGETAVRVHQVGQMRAIEQRVEATLNELASYSADKPELIAIFKKYGIEITAPPSQTPPSMPAQP
jgi:hypothetical protein